MVLYLEHKGKQCCCILDKNDTVLFEGDNKEGTRLWADMLKRSGILGPSTAKEAAFLRKEERKRYFLW